MKKLIYFGMLASLCAGFFFFTGGINATTGDVEHYYAPTIDNVYVNSVAVTSGSAASGSVSAIYVKNEFRLDVTATSSYEKDCAGTEYESISSLAGTLIIKKDTAVIFSKSDIKAASLDSKSTSGYFLASTTFNAAGTYTATWTVYSSYTQLSSTKTFTFTVPTGSAAQLTTGTYALTSFGGTCKSNGATLSTSDAAKLKDSKLTITSETALSMHINVDFGTAYVAASYPCLQKTYSFDMSGTYNIATIDTGKTFTINYNNDKNARVSAVFQYSLIGTTMKLVINDDSSNTFTYYFTKQ
jgi:hypothetical protein